MGGHTPLFGTVLALLVAGVGAPIPEDLSLLGAGYLVYRGDEHLITALLVTFVALIVGDVALFALGYHFGPCLTQHRFLRRRLTSARLERIRPYFHRHGAKTIFFARFVSGARALFFLAAGTFRMSFRRFLAFDMLAAVITAPLWVLLGRHFGPRIDRVRGIMHRGEIYLGLAALVVYLAFRLTRYLRRRLTGPPTELEPAAPIESQ
jgi:membrane protein DedA with SNARE-associated domain